MNWSRTRFGRVFYFLIAVPLTLAVLSALPQHAAPPPPVSEITFGVDPALSKVQWTLESTVHTVHGSFAFKKGSLQVDMSTGKASGESSWTQPAGIAATMDATRKCTGTFWRAASIQTSFFGPTTWKGKSRTKEYVVFRCKEFSNYMAANTR